MSLPSGLGAGGRGKEKAPCRYLHYELDWDPPAAGWEAEWKKEKERNEKERRELKAKEHRLQIGMGPAGKEVVSVRYFRSD
jgi:mRNA (2'-O-methyladenosine-N6-)-methyltransferase